MHLPENLREKLKQPMGILVKDDKTTKENLLRLIPKKTFLITVGDATTEKMIRYGFAPSLQIVDLLEQRSKREIPEGQVKTFFQCVNPAAQITNESVDVIKQAFSASPPVRIVVTGEEDLLVIPAVIYAPENSTVLYGQPNEGLVIVTVNSQTRKKAESIMVQMS
ncbi:MAG: GTP-dependent dephospho-CoA kinase family protein [Nitrososphaera sp.]